MSMPTDTPQGAGNAALARAHQEEDRLLPQIDHLTIIQLRRRAADNRDDAKRLGAIGTTCGIAMLIADAARCDRRATELEFESARTAPENQTDEDARHAPNHATRTWEFSVRLQTGFVGSPLRCQDSCIEVHLGQVAPDTVQPDLTKSNSDNATVALSPRKLPASFTANEVVRKTLQSLPRG